jgi:glucokinase
MKDIAVGIDIGGTITKIGLVTDDGKCLCQNSFRTRDFPIFADFLACLKKHIDQLVAECPEPVKIVAIGIGAPNASYHRGTLEYPANLAWKGITPFVADFKKMYDVPIKITNDANVAALGEMLYGNAKGMDDFIVITLGTGLGSGIVSNGEVIMGFDGFAGELGHFAVVDEGRLTGLGVRGGLEAYVSATGLKRTIMHMLAHYMDDSKFRAIAFNDLHGEEITEAAEAGDPIAIRAFEYTGEILGRALANFVTFSQPEAIFLLGGLANSGKWIFEPTLRYMEANLIEVYRGKVKLHASGMEEKNAAILGAAALGWKAIKQK